MTLDATLHMKVALARLLRPGEIGFVGVGSSGRAFELVTEIPLDAARVARAQGVDFAIQVGPLIEPDLESVPPDWRDEAVYSWPSAALMPSEDNLDAFLRGRVDVGFVSGAQIDRWGNVNVSRVRTGDGWRRLGGALAVPEHCAFAKRVLLLADLSPRTFVEDVDFVTGVGHRSGGRTRAEWGLPGGGPAAVVTDLGVFDFCDEGMRLTATFPGVQLSEILGRMSFQPAVAPDLTVLEPTADELACLRADAARSAVDDSAEDDRRPTRSEEPHETP